VLFEPLKPRPNPGVTKSLEKQQDAIATAAPVWNELLYGCYRLPESARRRDLERYVSQVLAPAIPVLPYDSESAHSHARERARLEGLGRRPAFVDGQIASIAKVRGLVLVTRNLDDFRDFEGLEVEDWSS
jgi:tRNA(fMet)-specific endonuclease VapC